jgi:hypothetical protein
LHFVTNARQGAAQFRNFLSHLRICAVAYVSLLIVHASRNALQLPILLLRAPLKGSSICLALSLHILDRKVETLSKNIKRLSWRARRVNRRLQNAIRPIRGGVAIRRRGRTARVDPAPWTHGWRREDANVSGTERSTFSELCLAKHGGDAARDLSIMSSLRCTTAFESDTSHYAGCAGGHLGP